MLFEMRNDATAILLNEYVDITCQIHDFRKACDYNEELMKEKRGYKQYYLNMSRQKVIKTELYKRGVNV